MGDSLISGKCVTLRLLGSVDIRAADDTTVSELIVRPKLIGILAYLAVAARGTYLRRDKLLAFFWPEDDLAHARSSLRTALHRIRVLVGSDIIRSRGADEVGIDPEKLWCDVTAFDELVASGRWADICGLYRGEFLDAFHLDASPEFETWVERTRATIRERAATGVRTLASQALAAGDYQEALKWSRRELEIAPADESALANLLTALASTGESAAAIEAYEEFAQRYRDDLGLELAPSTQALADRIRHAEFADVSPPRGVARVQLAPDARKEAEPGIIAEHSPRSFRLGILVPVTMVIFAAGFFAIEGGHRDNGRLVAWRSIATAEEPLPRAASSFVYDPESRQGLMFGGRTDEAVVSDVWRLKIAEDEKTGTWTRIPTESSSPMGRWLHFGAYDPQDDRLIVVAGSAGFTTPCLSDVWVLDHAMRGVPPLHWRQIRVNGESPAARAEFGGAYDPKTRRVMVQGGHDCIAPVYDDIWVLSDLDDPAGAKWTALHPRKPNGGPPPLRSQVMAFDPDHNRAIVFGGMDGRSPYGAVATNELWILKNANGLGGEPEWTRPLFQGKRAPATARATGIFDPETNRLIVFGGYHGSGSEARMASDVWVLEGANGLGQHAQWSRITPSGEDPGPRVGAGIAFDPNTERLIVVGGQAEKKNLGDVWVLTHATGSK